MSLNYVKDPASQVPTLPAASEGMDSIVKYYTDGTDEVKNLLKNECSMVFECRFCRSLFRSIINFVAHKRTICRSLHSQFMEEHIDLLRQNQPKEEDGQKKDGSNGNGSQIKRNVKLRRFNPASNINKHIRAVNIRLERANANMEIQTLPKVTRSTALTSFSDGKQVVEELPTDFSVKDHIPEDRIALVVPKETSTKYGDMQLRRRRSTLAKKLEDGPITKELTSNEIEIVERIPPTIPVDLQTLRCEDERCVKNGQRSFGFIAALAHHIAIQHQTDYTEQSLLKGTEPFIKCFLCDVVPFKKIGDLQKHFIAAHSDVRDRHMGFRLEQSINEPSKNRDVTQRSRSLSPVADTLVNTDNSPAKSNERSEKVILPKKRRKYRINNKPVIPKKNISKDEQLGQQLDAAKTLGEWLVGGGTETLKIHGPTKKQSDDFEESGSGNSKGNMEDPDNGDDDGKQTRNDSDSKDSQSTFEREGNDNVGNLLNLEEARKIDQLLNSKRVDSASQEENSYSDGTISDLNTQEEYQGNSLAHHRSRSLRSRRQTTKYDFVDIAKKRGRPRKIKGSSSEITRSDSATDISPKKKRGPKPGQIYKVKPGPKPKHKFFEKEKSTALEKQKTKLLKRKSIALLNDKIFKKVKKPRWATERPVQDFMLPASINGGSKTETIKHSETDSSDSVQLKEQIRFENQGHIGDKSEDMNVVNQSQLHSDVKGSYSKEDIQSVSTPRTDKIEDSNSGSSRRKQNFNAINTDQGDEFSVLGTTIAKPNKKNANEQKNIIVQERQKSPPLRPKDLAQIPVFLTEAQRDLFFKPLKALFNQSSQPDGHWQCGECGEVLKCIKDGRRHMVSHIRVIRVRCSLCDAGAFFCSDMRVHLMYRHCEKLNLAPENMLLPGIPCMDKEKADMLTKLVDPYSPGKAMYTPDKIVSWSSPTAYYPDPKIEANILGTAIPSYQSPKKVNKTAAILSSPKKFTNTQQHIADQTTSQSQKFNKNAKVTREIKSAIENHKNEQEKHIQVNETWFVPGDHDYPHKLTHVNQSEHHSGFCQYSSLEHRM